MKKALILFILIILAFSSCKKDGETAIVDKSEMEKGIYPDIILENAEYHIGENGSDPILLKAGKITFYSKDGYALTEDMTFSSQDEKGDIVFSGSAGRGMVNTDGSNMSL